MIIKNAKLFLDEPGIFDPLYIRLDGDKIAEIGENITGGVYE